MEDEFAVNNGGLEGAIACSAQLRYIPLEGKNKHSDPKSFHEVYVCSYYSLCPIDKIQHHQIFKCVLKFCQVDKISIRTCIFDDTEFCQLDKINSNCNLIKFQYAPAFLMMLNVSTGEKT